MVFVVWMSGSKRKKIIYERVRSIRIKEFGDDFGAAKEMARAMGIPYNTYRGYEHVREDQQRTNDEFLRIFAQKRKG